MATFSTIDIDESAVRELDRYAENTSELHGQYKSIIANLKRKIAKGTYDPALAPKLWRYWYDAASKAYNREGWQWSASAHAFDTATRQACAEQRATYEYERIIRGEHDA